MTIQTPQQIAEAIMGYDATDNDGRLPSEPEQIEALMIKAIEADRAQRSREYPLTLTHAPGAGWDGTHAQMLDTMADTILDDGPVDALLTYRDEIANVSTSVGGRWVGHSPRDGVTFETLDGRTLRIESEMIESLSV